MGFREIVTNQLFGFDCIEIPGHTPDQVTFYHQVSKGLFVGDLLIEHMSSNAFVEPDSNGNRPKTLVQQKLSLEKCLTLSVETVQKEKSNKKKILPFVMSTSMLTAAIFGAGSSALATGKGEETAFKNHGAEVSSFATSFPGSPEKGKFMRTIANNNLQEEAPNEDDSTDEDEATDVLVNEEERTDAPADEEETTDVPVDGEETTDAPADEEETTDVTVDKEESTDDSAEVPVEGDGSAEEPVNEAVQTTVWDKLVGYYQQVTTAYSSLLSSLKE